MASTPRQRGWPAAARAGRATTGAVPLRRTRRTWWGTLPRPLGIMLTALVGAAALLSVTALGAYAYFSRGLPSPEALTQRQTFQSTKILDRNGVLLYEVYDSNKGKRTVVPLKEIPPHVRNAFLAAEDARFYQHSGIDFQGITRAFFDNLTNRGTRIQGGSTITQQLVKNTLLSDERTFSRKIREAILAVDISRRYSKDQILELYLNTSFFGNQAYGVEAAAQTYFGKSIKDVNQAEAALLAGLLRSPSSSNPFKDEQAAKAEQHRVLEAMVRHGFLPEAEAGAAEAQPLQYNTKQFAEIKAPHFVIWVRDQLESNPKYGQQGLYERGLEVTTTLDVRLQEAAEQIVRDHVAGLGSFNVHDGALVALNPATGEVLAMVGSADYANKAIQGEVNVALAPRQPGSSIKPLTYLAAFLKGWSPGTLIEDVPTDFPNGPGQPPYRPRNYDGQFHGRVTARTALANSYNIPAVKTLQFVGVPGLVDLARRVGITTLQEPTKYGLALTLGGGEVKLLELTGAYGVLATGGQRVPPVSILKVTDTRGNLLDQYAGPKPEKIVDPAQAYLVTSILSDNQARTPAFGANSPLRLSRPAAVKTGTTDDFRDNWTLGYTSQLAVGVWVGNADNQPMRGTTGLTGAAPIWHDFMELALRPLPVDRLEPPAGVARAATTEDGKLWQEGCGEAKVEDLVVTQGANGAPKEKCTPPTATVAPTEPPATATAVPTQPAAPTATAAPSVEELRAQAAATATAVAASQATRAAEQRLTQVPATQAQPTQAPRTAVPPTPAPPTAAPATATRGAPATVAQPTVAPPSVPQPTVPPPATPQPPQLPGAPTATVRVAGVQATATVATSTTGRPR